MQKLPTPLTDPNSDPNPYFALLTLESMHHMPGSAINYVYRSWQLKPFSFYTVSQKKTSTFYFLNNSVKK